MDDTVYKLQKRVEQYSTEAQAYQVGDNRISIEIPGVSDANARSWKNWDSRVHCTLSSIRDSAGEMRTIRLAASGYALNKTIDELKESRLHRTDRYQK